jgi:hypothetical protein
MASLMMLMLALMTIVSFDSGSAASVSIGSGLS